MPSLTLRAGTPVRVKKGTVEVVGQCVALYEIGKNLEKKMVLAYCLQPGEKVSKNEEDDYIVEF